VLSIYEVHYSDEVAKSGTAGRWTGGPGAVFGAQYRTPPHSSVAGDSLRHRTDAMTPADYIGTYRWIEAVTAFLIPVRRAVSRPTLSTCFRLFTRTRTSGHPNI
jgi:hypothetical protein